MKLKPRVAAIVPKNQSILLVKHKHGGKKYWVPPGGKIEAGETIKEACKREVKEETRLDVKPKYPIYYNDLFEEERSSHTLEFFFICKLLGGKLELGEDPENEDGNEILKDASFVPYENLGEIYILPEGLKTRLLEDVKEGFDMKPVYLPEVKESD